MANVPDRRAMEKMTADIESLLKEKNFKSIEEANKYLEKITKGKIPKSKPKNADQFAQDIMYEAWEADTGNERVRLAKEALSISPNCADAYNLLAEEAATSTKEALGFYLKGVEAGKRSLGPKIFKEEKGHFWGMVKTRPFMRAKVGLMQAMWELGYHDEALLHAKELIELNESDNQGIRYVFISYLAELGKYDELDEFMKKEAFEDDGAAEWLYTKALLRFVQQGDSEQSRQELKTAIENNAYVPEYLSGKKHIPLQLPDTIIRGGEDEGYCYAAGNKSTWQKVPGAIEWLKQQAGIKFFPNVGRNEPCPCGSGKKFKHCCI